MTILTNLNYTRFVQKPQIHNNKTQNQVKFKILEAVMDRFLVTNIFINYNCKSENCRKSSSWKCKNNKLTGTSMLLCLPSIISAWTEWEKMVESRAGIFSVSRPTYFKIPWRAVCSECEKWYFFYNPCESNSGKKLLK